MVFELLTAYPYMPIILGLGVAMATAWLPRKSRQLRESSIYLQGVPNMTTTAFDDQFAPEPSTAFTITLEADEAEALRTLLSNLQRQDSHGVATPVFEVRKDRAFECDPDICDAGFWVDYSDNRVTDKELADKLTKLCSTQTGNEVVYDGDTYHEEFYMYSHQVIASFFTQKAADEFIANNKHNHMDSHRPLYVYVTSGWRNPEWQLIRKMLRSIEFSE
jgi:hypothetical protein